MVLMPRLSWGHPTRSQPEGPRLWTRSRPASELFPDDESDAWDKARSSQGSIEAILDEMTDRWEQGTTPRAEEFIRRLPTGDSVAVVELVYHEYCLAQAKGLGPDPSDYLLRFPRQRDHLARLFELHRALPEESTLDLGNEPPVGFVGPGDEIGPYRLVRELGRGGIARVFLAEQMDLEDRLVVVKVATRPTTEPQLLARAPHAHIVEVLREATTEDGLQLICMPFLGGATLSALLAERRRLGRSPRTGLDLLDDLDAVSALEYPSATVERPAREILTRLTYPKAIAWIVARLAEGLDHAYGRGVTHGDLKPSNVLLSADGHPLLFDFNLAVDWRSSEAVPPSGDTGGTLAYMAPERLHALAHPAAAAAARPIDRHRADLYALGLILLEAISGAPPSIPSGPLRSCRSLAAMLASARRRGVDGSRQRLAGVPASFRPILWKCLAPHPANRYRRASELARDLDRWRADRPLVFARPAAWSEPVRWARRRRQALIAGLACVLVGGACSMVVANRYEDSSVAQAALSKLSQVWDHRRPGVFRSWPAGAWEPRPVGDIAVLTAQSLNAYNIAGPHDWRVRDDVQTLPESARADLEMWILEQAWRHSSALLDPRRPTAPEEIRAALHGLERLIAQRPARPLLDQRSALREALGFKTAYQTAPTSRVPGWIDAYLLGVASEGSRPREALDHYRNVLTARPDSFWAHYRTAAVLFRLGEYQAACEHLEHCLDQQPENPALLVSLSSCYYHRGLLVEAAEWCERALALEPNLEEGLRNQLFLDARSGDQAKTARTMQRIQGATQHQGMLPVWNTQLDLLFAPLNILRPIAPTPQERVGLVQRIAMVSPNYAEVHDVLGTELDRIGQSSQALRSYSVALTLNPDHLRALHNRGKLNWRLGHNSLALQDFRRLVEHPCFEELLTQDPIAIRAFSYLIRHQLERDQFERSIRLAKNALARAHRLEIPSLQAILHYDVALAHVGHARSDQDLLPVIANELMIASGYYPEILSAWYDNDPHFHGLRPALTDLLD